MNDQQLLNGLSSLEKKLRTLAEYYLQTEIFTVSENYEHIVDDYNSFILASSTRYLRSIFILIKQDASLDAIIIFRTLLENNINLFYGNNRKIKLIKEIATSIAVISQKLVVKNNCVFNRKEKVGWITSSRRKVNGVYDSKNMFWTIYPLLNFVVHNNFINIYFVLNKDFKFTSKQNYGTIIVAALSLYIYCCIFKFVILENKKEYYSPNYYYRCRKTILAINKLLINAFRKIIDRMPYKDKEGNSFVNRNCRYLRYSFRKIIEELYKEVEFGVE